MKTINTCFEHDFFHNNLKGSAYGQVIPRNIPCCYQNRNPSQSFCGDNFTFKNFKKLSLLELLLNIRPDNSPQPRILLKCVIASFHFWEDVGKTAIMKVFKNYQKTSLVASPLKNSSCFIHLDADVHVDVDADISKWSREIIVSYLGTKFQVK